MAENKCDKNFISVIQNHPSYTPDFSEYDVKLWGHVMPREWFEVQASLPTIRGYIKFHQRDFYGSFFLDGTKNQAVSYTIYGSVEIIFSKDVRTKTKEEENA